METLLEVKNLTKNFTISTGRHKHLFTAVNKVSFSVQKGEILGLLGESGCGKSTLANMILHMIPVTEGKILYRGTEIQNLTQKEFHPYRKKMQMVLQNPFSALDPHMKIESILMEPLKIWKIGNNKKDRLDYIHEVCNECGITDTSILSKRASEFSGGQLQRLAIARALLLNPEFLIADEIVSALDIPIQNQILELLLSLKEKRQLTLIMITHDLTVMSSVSDYVIVMKNGQIVEHNTPNHILTSDNEYIRELQEAIYLF